MDLQNPYHSDIDFANQEFPVKMQIAYLVGNAYRMEDCRLLCDSLKIAAGTTITVRGIADFPTVAEKKLPGVVCLSNRICTSVNSRPFVIQTEEQ